MNFRSLITVLMCITVQSVWSQSYSAKILDAKSKKPVPYATVEFGENLGVIANDEGEFSFSGEISLDSLYISSLGYERMGIAPETIGDSILFLKPKAIKLDGVYLFDNPLSVDEIMERTRDKLEENYRPVSLKQQIFLRESSQHNLATFDIEMDKSTIAEIDEPLMDSIVRIIPRKSEYYTETLGYFYRSPDKYKLAVTKAAQLYDKSNDGSMENLGEKLEDIFKENVKSDSYLKFKSGIFSQKVQVEEILEEAEEAKQVEKDTAKPKKSYFVSERKRVLDDIIEQFFYQDDPKLDVFKKMGRYEFRLLGFTDLEDEGVYVIAFEPKRSADFKGRLFINIEDYGIMRFEFQNVKRLRNFRLFGFTYRENAYRGTYAFSRVSGGPYALKFAEILIGREMGVDRPLKVIEKNKYVKGRRKQNELSFNLKLVDNNYDKIELVVFNSEKIDAGQFQNAAEDKTIKATYMPKYDPEFWEGYTIMEPNSAIRSFRVAGE